MDLLIRNIDGSSAVWKVDPDQTVLTLKEEIFLEHGIDPGDQTLIYNGQPMDDWRCFSDYEIAERFGLRFSFNHKDLNLKKLAEKYRIDKMVCRKCYARLPAGATNCRKRKCGHSSDLRPKSKPEEHDRKKH